MLIIIDSAEMAAALSTITDTTLKRILSARVEQLAEYVGYELGELAHFLIVQPGDTIDAIEAALGFSPIANPVEVITDHDGWCEATFIVSDDGFGWVVLVPDDPRVPLQLLKPCEGTSEARENL